MWRHLYSRITAHLGPLTWLFWLLKKIISPKIPKWHCGSGETYKRRHILGPVTFTFAKWALTQLPCRNNVFSRLHLREAGIGIWCVLMVIFLRMSEPCESPGLCLTRLLRLLRVFPSSSLCYPYECSCFNLHFGNSLLFERRGAWEFAMQFSLEPALLGEGRIVPNKHSYFSKSLKGLLLKLCHNILCCYTIACCSNIICPYNIYFCLAVLALSVCLSSSAIPSLLTTSSGEAEEGRNEGCSRG